jgi:hypothetical protein
MAESHKSLAQRQRLYNDVVSKPHFQPNFVNRTTSVAGILTPTFQPHYLIFLFVLIENEVISPPLALQVQKINTFADPFL